MAIRATWYELTTCNEYIAIWLDKSIILRYPVCNRWHYFYYYHTYEVWTGMEYHFERQEITGDRVLFSLSLDKKSGKERILIGTETEIIKRLWGDSDAKIYYDEVNPIGTLFINKRQDGTDWTDRGFMPLWNALHTTRWKQPELERSAASFCTDMYQSGDPFAIYTAIRLWGGYLRAREPRDRNQAAELFRLDLMGLISPMEKYSPDELLDRSITDVFSPSPVPDLRSLHVVACFVANISDEPVIHVHTHDHFIAFHLFLVDHDAVDQRMQQF